MDFIPGDTSIEDDAGNFNVSPSQALSYFVELKTCLQNRTEEVRAFAKYADCYDHESAQKLYRLLESSIEFAKILLWKRNIWLTAISGSEKAFVGAKIEPWSDGEFGMQFWIFDFMSKPFGMANETENLCTHCIMLMKCGQPDDQGRALLVPIILLIKIIGEKDEAQDEDVLPRLRFFPPIIAGEINEDILSANLLAGMKFIKLPFIDIAETKPPRHERRQYERAYKKRSPDIRTVLLRMRAETPQDEVHRQEIEWACHWMVQPHWRMQWYSSEQTHKQIFINAFLKGDFSKPFKPPVETVFKVVR